MTAKQKPKHRRCVTCRLRVRCGSATNHVRGMHHRNRLQP